MAVTAVRALRTVEGSARLILAYWLLSLLAALPGLTIGRSALRDVVGDLPYFTDAPDPLPLPQAMGLLREVPGVMWGALGAGLLMAWLGRLALTAAAVDILDPGVTRRARVRVWRAVFDRGSTFVLPYVRVAIASVLFLALGTVFVGVVFALLDEAGQTRGWTARTMYVEIPRRLALVLLVWATGVGVYAFWARVALVAERRRSVVKLLPDLVNLSVRRPLVFLGFHGVLSVASVALASEVLLSWRQSPSGAGLFLALWFFVLLLQAFVWHWRLRVCRLVWAAYRRPSSGLPQA